MRARQHAVWFLSFDRAKVVSAKESVKGMLCCFSRFPICLGNDKREIALFSDGGKDEKERRIQRCMAKGQTWRTGRGREEERKRKG